MRIETFSDRASWLAARRLGIGGSDVPAILGLSPWRTPLQVWSEKVGLSEEQEDSYVLRRGTHMETMLARELERETGLVVWPPAELAPETWKTEGIESTVPSDVIVTVVHGDHPMLRYSPDAIAFGGHECTEDATGCSPSGDHRLVEFKSHPRGASEWDGAIPEHVRAQVLYGLEVCDLVIAYVAVDLGTEFRWARVERDRAWFADVLPKLREFWRLVETETPPPPTGDEGDKAVLGRLWPREQAGLTKTLPDELFDLSAQYDEAAKAASAAKAQMDEIANRVRAALGDAECGVLPDGSGWTCKTQERAAEEKPRAAWSGRVLRRVKRKER